LGWANSIKSKKDVPPANLPKTSEVPKPNEKKTTLKRSGAREKERRKLPLAGTAIRCVQIANPFSGVKDQARPKNALEL